MSCDCTITDTTQGGETLPRSFELYCASNYWYFAASAFQTLWFCTAFHFKFNIQQPKLPGKTYSERRSSVRLTSVGSFCNKIASLSGLACEQALLFGRAKRAARARASVQLWRLLSRVYFSRYPPNGELARRLRPVRQCVCCLYHLLLILSGLIYDKIYMYKRLHRDNEKCLL